ncbi:UDP-glucose--hexose-1-phosphate uridylyltransferase [Flavobacteriaceae bacterium]|nr:UDP-glucose--hexose-1-phosphate uridylyltransferase [Flavobacteriaceae bacterium]
MESIIKSTHIRKNILTGDKVLVSPHRTNRPWQGKVEEKELAVGIPYDSSCYLCPTNSRANGDLTPDYNDTFVFVNDFSALLPKAEKQEVKKGLLEANSERGICKVICFSPNHSLTLSKMSIAEIKKVVQTWQKEFKELSNKEFINSVQIFENRGEIMGCSNPHPHGQIWAQETIPTEINKKTTIFLKYYKENNLSILEDYLKQEIEEKERIVYQNEDFVVLVPFWAVWPYETMIIPKYRSVNILSMNENIITNYANAIKVITSIYDKVFEISFPYSAGIHQAPTDIKNYEGWHWHMSFYPPLLRSATVKKFMVGYEMFAMPQRDITPEQAANLLKNITKAMM